MWNPAYRQVQIWVGVCPHLWRHHYTNSKFWLYKPRALPCTITKLTPESSKPTTMNSKTVLLLLGTACLFALIHVSAGVYAPGTAKVDVTNGKPGRIPTVTSKMSNFQKEVERIFDAYNVDPVTRDHILNRIKQRMVELHVTVGFRWFRHSGWKWMDNGDQDKTQ